MAGGSLLALLDDISAILDDVAAMTKVAAQKTAGVLGDDLALNAEQVAGVTADRELPVVWAVAKGSFINKLILIPLALALSAFAPAWVLTALLMVGGAYLCFEGFEKLAHKYLHNPADEKAHHDELMNAIEDEQVDMVQFEKEKIKGAIRTDFVLSAEIIVLTLGVVVTAQMPLIEQLAVLCGIGIIMTVGVYGLVAGIVKLDDAGLYLTQKYSGALDRFGRFLLWVTPYIMKGLTIVGTAAMFMVGGGIISHGIPALHHFSAAITAGLSSVLSSLVGVAIDAAVGVVAGALVLLCVQIISNIFNKKTS